MTTLPKRFVQRLENSLFFLTLLLLPTQLGRHFWPDFSFVYSVKIDYLSPTVYVWDLLVICLIFSFIIQAKHVNRVALNIALIFLLVQILSLLHLLASAHLINIGAGLVRVEQYLVAALFGVYIASQNLKELLKKIFWPLGIAILFISILGILQFIFGHSIGFWILGERTFTISTPAIAKFDYHSWQFLRPYATFSHPNVLSAFILLSIPILMLGVETGKQKKMLYAVLTLGGLTTILTVSRIVLVASIINLSFFLRKKLLLIFIGTLLLISPILYTRFASIQDYDSLSLTRREQMNEIAINLSIQNPLLGVGVNNFIPSAADQLLVGPSRFLQPVHNIYLLTLSETGTAGLLVLLLIFAYAIYSINKLDASRFVKNTLFLVWISIVFLGLFDHYLLTAPQGYRLLFLVWGLSLANMERNLN